MIKEMKNSFVDAWLPTKPLASNDIKYGLKRHGRDVALNMRWVESYPKHARNLIVVDVDEDHAASKLKDMIHEDGVLPEPFYITTNPISTHAQAGWFIGGHVGTERGQAWFVDVARGLRVAAGGDAGYGGRTMRNPLVDTQVTEWGEAKLYTLRELAAFLPKREQQSIPLLPTGVELTGGRNVDTFNALRVFAYRHFNRVQGGPDFEVGVFERAVEINLSWVGSEKGMLDARELQGIVDQVTRFVRTRFSTAQFSRIQAARVAKRWRGTAEAREGRRAAIAGHLAAGLSIRQVAAELGLSYEATKKAIQQVKRLGND